uniref:Calcium voltage-gated channel auxiliary subunit gamma 3 n=1 Tax=Eptatretus burgeri TaxID=7764 RepID=A0A8C4QBP1_EPTBU
MGQCDPGGRMLLTTIGAFAAFSLMTIAVGTDYWLYSRGVCKAKMQHDNETGRKNEEVMTHSGLWRTCCLEGSFKGICKKIDYFPEDGDYDKENSDYLLRSVRASSVFPILSATLLLLGGVSVAASEFYKNRHNILLSAGIFCVSAGLSNIIGIIVYISSNSGDPNQGDSKKSSYSYGWSFYFGALSFILAEVVGVVAVHAYIDKTREARSRFRPNGVKRSVFSRLPSHRYRYRRRSRSSSRSTEPPRSLDASPGMLARSYMPPPFTDIPLYTLSREAVVSQPPPTQGIYNSILPPTTGQTFLQVHDYPDMEAADALSLTNRRTTPV